MAWEQYQQQADGPGAQEDARRRRQQQGAAPPAPASPQLNQALSLTGRGPTQAPVPGGPAQTMPRPNPAAMRPQGQGSPWAAMGQAQQQPLVGGAPPGQQAPKPALGGAQQWASYGAQQAQGAAPQAQPQVGPMGLSTQAQPLVQGAPPAGPAMSGVPAGWTPPDNMFGNPNQGFTGGMENFKPLLDAGGGSLSRQQLKNLGTINKMDPTALGDGRAARMITAGESSAGGQTTSDGGVTPGGQVTKIDVTENQKAIYTPREFADNPNAFNFDQYDKWATQYGNMAQDAGAKASQNYQDQAAVRGVQDELMAGAADRQTGMNRAADDSRTRLNATQGYVGNLASGAADTAGGVGQKSIQQMSLDAAAGNGPTAAGAQFQRQTDANIAAVRSAMAGSRGMSAGQAARMGGQQVADLQAKASQDAAMLRAQEQQAAMGLAGSVTGQARGQDLQAAGLSSQLALGAQKQLADQAGSNLTASGNLAEQIRSADTGLYSGNMNQQNAGLGAGLGLDQQQLALKQAKEEYDYNRYRDWQNWMVTQYGGEGNYQAPWKDQAWAQAGAGAVQGGVEGLINWATK